MGWRLVGASSAYVRLRSSEHLSMIAIMSALALVGNYALVAIPNVELGTTVLFVTASVFGFSTALTCVILMSIVYSWFNPWGAFVPQIWLGQVCGWILIVALGAYMGSRLWKRNNRAHLVVLTLAGALGTFYFDLVTNIAWSWTTGIPIGAVLVTGIPFMLMHVVSNAVLFPLVTPPLHGAITQVLKTGGPSDLSESDLRAEEQLSDSQEAHAES
ncbi:MAG: hypothetical protein HXY34_11750 [Candidatus Thorarchaeota archaeon]|nr:hypothetical protein [Candidatus Thorarchaeota archaeon]